MQIRRIAILVVAMLTSAAAAWAQAAPQTAPAPAVTVDAVASPDISTVNYVDFGFRGTVYGEGSDEARHQRYRDLRSGVVPERFRFSKDSASQWFTVTADNIGYRDQRYFGSLDKFGKLKASFEWNQIPLFYSEHTATLFTEQSPGTLLMDDLLQSAIQNAQNTLSGVALSAVPFEMRQKRSIGDFRFSYAASDAIDVSLAVKNTQKQGSQPWAGTYGFSNAVELAVPIDTNTTEFGSALDWSGKRGSARVAYDASYFTDDSDTLVWDNPLRITDSTSAGPVQGRMSLWPNSRMNTGSFLGTIILPKRSQASAYVSVGSWSQEADLIPFTSNTVLPVLPLDRPTGDATAMVTATQFAFTSRPASRFTFNARYRSYDLDNNSAQFRVAETVSYDTKVAAYDHGGNSPYSFARDAFDTELSYSPAAHVAVRGAYTVDQMGQTFRQFDSTTENKVSLSADLTGVNMVTLRAVYEHAKRTGTGLDDQVLDSIGEQTSLRQFDMSDRIADRLSLVATVSPLPTLSFSAHATTGDDDRSDEGFGVLNGRMRSYSVGFDYVPKDTVALSLSYVYDKFGTLQRSRQANPGVEFEDPTRDWTTDATERADTVTAAVDLLKLWPRTDFRFGYDFSNATSLYFYGVPSNSTLTPPTQLPMVENQLQRATFDMRYYLNPHVAVGGVYWFDQSKTQDFAANPETLDSLAMPSFLILGYTLRPYTANTFVGRVTYIW